MIHPIQFMTYKLHFLQVKEVELKYSYGLQGEQPFSLKIVLFTQTVHSRRSARMYRHFEQFTFIWLQGLH